MLVTMSKTVGGTGSRAKDEVLAKQTNRNALQTLRRTVESRQRSLSNNNDRLRSDFSRSASRSLPIPRSLSTSIHEGRQGKHVPTHPNFKIGKSQLNDEENPRELLAGIHSGKYNIVSRDKRGNILVDFGRSIGIDARSGLPTQYGKVHDGNQGAHIVPAHPGLIFR